MAFLEDIQKFKRCLKIAEQQGDPNAQKRINEMYRRLKSNPKAADSKSKQPDEISGLEAFIIAMVILFLDIRDMERELLGLEAFIIVIVTLFIFGCFIVAAIMSK